MKLTIIAPQGGSTINDVDKVSLPGSQGSFMVLRGHAPLITTLTKGKVQYEHGGEEKVIEVEGGVIEVTRDVVKVVVEQ